MSEDGIMVGSWQLEEVRKELAALRELHRTSLMASESHQAAVARLWVRVETAIDQLSSAASYRTIDDANDGILCALQTLMGIERFDAWRAANRL